MGKQWKQWQTILGSSKITADGNCSHEIKRCLLLGKKKAMTNLGSILKKKWHYFADKGPYSQSYGCSSHVWTWELENKKAEHWRIDAFKLWCWRRLLRVPWTARSSNQSILKDIGPKYSLEGLKPKLQYLGRLIQRANSLKKTDAGKDWGQEEKGAAEDEMVGWHQWLNEHEFEQTQGESEGQGRLVCWSPWVCKELYTT